MSLKTTLKTKIGTFVDDYHHWSYWNNIYKQMNNKQKRISKKGEQIPYINKPGIAFSFDDSFRVNDWYKYGKDLFGYHDVKVTFNINSAHHFENQREHTQREIDMLLELQANGHELALHGFKHRDALAYSREKGIQTWIDEEIITLIDWIEKQEHSRTGEKFKKPVSFAFPGSSFNDSNVKELVGKYFKIVRGHLYHNHLTAFNHTGLAPSVCIDQVFLQKARDIRKLLRATKRSGRNLIFMCHSILPEEFKWEGFGWGEESAEAGIWRITPGMIQEIINEARELDLEFYTTSELAGVASFTDQNFEKCVRELLSHPLAQWISISELSSIRELDLRNKGITNLDGIQYFLNLEKLNLINNNISDLRLLQKLPKLKEVQLLNSFENEIIHAV